jgi:sensor histidine kinase YesM
MSFIRKYHQYKWFKIMVHILAWLLLWSIPYLFSLQDQPVNIFRYLHGLTLLTFSALVFYANYYYLIDTTLFKKKYGRYVLFNLALIVASIFLMEEIRGYLRSLYPTQREFSINFPLLYFRLGVILFLSAGISLAIKATGQWFRAEDLRKKMETEQLKTEVANLKVQLHPHFFFNTLNNIYALVEKDPSEAQEAIHHLSKLMRYLLYETQSDHVLLKDEITFLENYIRLMKLRLPGHVKVITDFPETTGSEQIAPSLFISLVENAFKHGISASDDSFIKVSLSKNGKELFFRVENSFFPKHNSDRSGSGIGLDNLQKRLDLIYPKQYELNQTLNDNNYVAELKINI